ncbi:MAG TPA: tetratricopeptide repeat protein [Bdellovibrionota bacterium]
MKRRHLVHLSVVILPLLFSGCFKTRQEIAREKEDVEVRTSLQQNIVDYSQGLEKTQADLGRLQGRIEELEHARKKEMAGVTASNESDRKAIEELKAKITSMQEAQNALFEEVKKLREDNLASASRPAAPAPGSAKKKVSGGKFSSAMGSFKEKDFQGAAAGFRAYLDANPKGKLVLDAHFYLGESLYQQKSFEEAVAEFAVVHEKAPGVALGRKATLRLAQSFKAMGKGKDAKAFAQLLVQGSPDSAEAKEARKLLK